MKRLALTLLLVVVIAAPSLVPAGAQDDGKVSMPGVYRGYSEKIYDGWARTSQYVAVRDGTRLAVDIFRPTLNGVVVDDPLPVIWTHHRYHRADMDANGQITSIVDGMPGLVEIIEHGYVIGVVDVRGGGASFGTRRGEFTPEEAQDAYDMTEWFAAQPWSTGNIGMFGLSYLGITQYFAASTAPPHLKAIFPMMAMFDMYSFAYPGGIFRQDFIQSWGAGNVILDKIRPAAPVDDDPGGVLLAQAIAEHANNANIYFMAQGHPYRDSVLDTGEVPYQELSPASYVDAINASGVAVYTLAGWYDMYPRDAVLWFNNLTVPQKLIITPWSHNGSGGFDLVAEHLRWFDYWLKGIDNGIMDEPPIYYNVMGSDEWRFASQWPLPEQQPTPYYLAAGPSGSSDSANDGLLNTAAPSDTGQDAITFNLTTSSGKTTRWTDGYGGGFGYSDMAANDAKGLTYSSDPLGADIEVTGHPIVHLWLSATQDDADVYVYLEEVDENGVSTYITEGVLRASYRALSDAPFNNIGLPFHRGNEADVTPLTPGEPAELVLDLHPTSNIFDAGHRIRITITGADVDNYAVQASAPTVTIYRDAAHASYVELPIIPPSE